MNNPFPQFQDHIQSHSTMHEVKVKRIELLSKVKSNRDAHRNLFIKAQKVYRDDVITELDSMLKDARDGRKLKIQVMLNAPMDHSDDYDRVITMLEMSVDDIIELDSSSFDQYVMDNWSWSRNANATNSFYANKVGASRG